MTSINDGKTWWFQIAIESSIGWPTEEMEIMFDDETLYLCPAPDPHCMPTIAVRCAPHAERNAEFALISRFVSALSWSKDGYVRLGLQTAGHHRIKIRRPTTHSSVIEKRHFTTHDIPNIAQSDAQIAMALYREANGSENIFYKILSYAKILNIRMSAKAPQVAWINGAVGKIKGYDTLPRLRELQVSAGDIGKYIYVSCRCAVAHANCSPVADPDNPDDIRRLHKDVRLIKEFVEIYIEEEMGVKSRMTIYREHAYELNGFKALIGKDTVELLKAGDTAVSIDVSQWPPVSIGLERHGPYDVFQSLRFSSARIEAEKSVVLELSGHNGICRVMLVLDFKSDRIHFEPWEGMAHISEDGSSRAPLLAASLLAFQIDYLSNGCLEVLDLVTSTQVARKDAYLGNNIDLGRTVNGWTESIKECQRVAAEREKVNAGEPTPGGSQPGAG